MVSSNPFEHPVIIGSRGSALALWQAQWVCHALEYCHPDVPFEIKVIKTKGDKILDAALSKIGDKGLFTREIEQELTDGHIDLAVHSLKDLPTTLPAGLIIGAITMREHPEDVLVCKNQYNLHTIPPGSTVLTGSLRRRSQLLHIRPDLVIEDVRGNVQTRLKKLDEGPAVALILAHAGLVRLNLHDRIAQVLEPGEFIPAVGQGALAIEVRSQDFKIHSLVQPLNHSMTARCCLAERTMLHALEGGCQIPIGAYAVMNENRLCLVGMIASIDGKKYCQTSVSGDSDQYKNLGCLAAEKLLKLGGKDILAEIRYNCE